MKAAIEHRMTQLREELQKADEELSKLRPRVQYLETIAQRLDGALTVLQGLLDASEPALTPALDGSMAQPVAP